MNENQSANETQDILPATSEIPIPRTVRFWLLLLFDVPSIACTFFVLFSIFFYRDLRSNIKNHVLTALLILGLATQLIDVPFYLSFITHSSVIPATELACVLWWFSDIGMYNGGAILLAWTAFERHIIVFHDQWISTRKRRLFVHYAPLIFLLLYIFVYNIYMFYGFPCENTYDYTSLYCNGFPCYGSDPVWGMYDLIANLAMPTFLEAFFSLTFLFRVIWQKHHLRVPTQRRKLRKMTIQLISLSGVNLTINIPLATLYIAHLCGLPPDAGAEAAQYFFFLCYFVVFFIPFICFATISNVYKKIYRRIFPQQRQLNQFTATAKPWNFRTNINMSLK